MKTCLSEIDGNPTLHKVFVFEVIKKDLLKVIFFCRCRGCLSKRIQNMEHPIICLVQRPRLETNCSRISFHKITGILYYPKPPMIHEEKMINIQFFQKKPTNARNKGITAKSQSRRLFFSLNLPLQQLGLSVKFSQNVVSKSLISRLAQILRSEKSWKESLL